VSDLVDVLVSAMRRSMSDDPRDLRVKAETAIRVLSEAGWAPPDREDKFELDWWRHCFRLRFRHMPKVGTPLLGRHYEICEFRGGEYVPATWAGRT
jgi:hypothetical protein